MSSSSPKHRPVDVFADCTVDTPAGRIVVSGSGQTIALTAGSTRTFRRLLNAARSSRDRREALLQRLSAGLAISDLNLSLRTGRREIARMEPGRTGGLAARFLSLPGIRLRPAGLILSLLSNR